MATVKTTASFRKSAKHLLKRYPSFHQDLSLLEQKLTVNPTEGKFLGHGLYKIRLRITSKNKVKSGGARVITLVELELVGVVESDQQTAIVNLLYVYDKSETGNISDAKLSQLMQSFISENEEAKKS